MFIIFPNPDPLSQRQQRLRKPGGSVRPDGHGGGMSASYPVLGGRQLASSHGQGVVHVRWPPGVTMSTVTCCTSCTQSYCPQGSHVHLDTLHCLLCASRVCSEYNSVDRLAIITWRRVEAQASLVATSRRASVGQRFADESAAGCAFAKTEGA